MVGHLIPDAGESHGGGEVAGGDHKDVDVVDL